VVSRREEYRAIRPIVLSALLDEGLPPLGQGERIVEEVARAENGVHAVTLREAEDAREGVDACSCELAFELLARNVRVAAAKVPVCRVEKLQHDVVLR
jgi:hypothetical protein